MERFSHAYRTQSRSRGRGRTQAYRSPGGDRAALGEPCTTGWSATGATLSPAPPASVRRSRPSDPAPAPRASGPRRIARCPRRSRRPPRRSRHCGGPARRLPRENPHATPCRSARETAIRVLPCLSHVITVWSFRTLSDPARLSPSVMPSPLSASLSNQGSFPPPALPGIRGNTSPSATLPARPAPRGVRVDACHATDRASRVATAPLFHAWRRHYPGGAGRCARRSLPGRYQPSPFLSRVGLRVARFEACSAFTCVAARMVAEPPLAARCIGVLRSKSLPPSTAPFATGWSDSCRAGFAPVG